MSRAPVLPPDVLAVACPHCHARPWHRCRTADGAPAVPHRARVQRYEGRLPLVTPMLGQDLPGDTLVGDIGRGEPSWSWSKLAAPLAPAIDRAVWPLESLGGQGRAPSVLEVARANTAVSDAVSGPHGPADRPGPYPDSQKAKNTIQLAEGTARGGPRPKARDKGAFEYVETDLGPDFVWKPEESEEERFDYTDTASVWSELDALDLPRCTEVDRPETRTPFVMGVPWRQRVASTGAPLGWCMRLGKIKTVVCSNGHEAKKHVGCTKLDCMDCATAVKNRRAVASFERMGGQDLAAVVFTVPREWNDGDEDDWEDDGLSVEEAGWLRHLAVRVMARAVHDYHGARIGGYAAIHPAGDKRPNEKLFHVHVGYPTMGVCIKTGEPVSWEPKEDRAFLDLLRHYWGLMLADVGEELGRGMTVPNVNYSFRCEVGKKLHRMGYDQRPFPAWWAGSAAPLRRIMWWGLMAPNCQLEGVEAWREAVAGNLEAETPEMVVDEDGNEVPAPTKEIAPEDVDKWIRRGHLCHVEGCGCRELTTTGVHDARDAHLFPGPVLEAWNLTLPQDALEDAGVVQRGWLVTRPLPPPKSQVNGNPKPNDDIPY